MEKQETIKKEKTYERPHKSKWMLENRGKFNHVNGNYLKKKQKIQGFSPPKKRERGHKTKKEKKKAQSSTMQGSGEGTRVGRGPPHGGYKV